MRPPANGDSATVGRELHCIGQQIERDLLERSAIGFQFNTGRKVGTKRQALFIGPPQDNSKFGHDLIEFNGLRMEVDAAGLDLDMSRMSLMIESRCWPLPAISLT